MASSYSDRKVAVEEINAAVRLGFSENTMMPIPVMKDSEHYFEKFFQKSVENNGNIWKSYEKYFQLKFSGNNKFLQENRKKSWLPITFKVELAELHPWHLCHSPMLMSIQPILQYTRVLPWLTIFFSGYCWHIKT